MKLSTKMRERIKKRILKILSIVTVVMVVLAVNKTTNLPETIREFLKNNIKTQEAEDLASSYAISQTIIDADIYVSTKGNDETGDGSYSNPYATVSKAINTATNGQKIYIFPGTYTLSHISSSYGTAGIYDYGKSIEIFGENDETILIYD